MSSSGWAKRDRRLAPGTEETPAGWSGEPSGGQWPGRSVVVPVAVVRGVPVAVVQIVDVVAVHTLGCPQPSPCCGRGRRAPRARRARTRPSGRRARGADVRRGRSRRGRRAAPRCGRSPGRGCARGSECSWWRVVMVLAFGHSRGRDRLRAMTSDRLPRESAISADSACVAAAHAGGSEDHEGHQLQPVRRPRRPGVRGRPGPQGRARLGAGEGAGGGRQPGRLEVPRGLPGRPSWTPSSR